MNDNKSGAKLFLCATPIGNLGDITLRAIETLRAADKIYCEDTRNTLKLLNALEIKKPLESCHEHNEQQRAKEIAAEVRGGMTVAFVSDAGLPFEVLPGASAMVTAWVASGLPTESLHFIGFLPRSGKERTEAIERLVTERATCVLYESPLRVGATLAELVSALEKLGENEAERPCCLVRELTKTFEECIRGVAKELARRFSEEPPRGECVLLLGGASEETEAAAARVKLDKLLGTLMDEGLSVKTASRIAAETLGLPKNAVYTRAMELENK